MSVQMGLDVPRLVLPITAQDIDVVLDRSDYYVAEGLRVQDTSDYLWAIVFSLLSVQSPFAATTAVWHKLHAGVDLTNRWEVYEMLVQTQAHDGVVQYPLTKSHWIADFVSSIYQDGVDYRACGTDDDYRNYLRKNIRGFAWAKSSFAVMLVRGLADVCCIDTHMHRLLTGNVAKDSITKGRYLLLESQVRDWAGRHNLPTSVAQHCLWDSMRGKRSKLLP